jgi:hypothetical protein
MMASIVVLFVVSGCGHASTVPHYSGGALGDNSTRASTAFAVPASGRLLTWMFVPPHNSWDGNPIVRTMLDFGVVNQSEQAGQQSQRLFQIGVTSIEYTNPNRQAESDEPNPEYTSDELTFAHPPPDAQAVARCFPDPDNRLFRLYYNRRYFQMQPDSQHLARLWANEIINFASPTRPPKWHWAYGGERSFVFEDVADNIDSLNGVPCGFESHENWTNLSIQLLANTNAAYRARFGQDMPGVIYNGLDPIMSSDPRPAIGLNASPYVVGGLAENCYVRAAGAATIPVQDMTPSHSPWSALENTEILMAHAQKLFICLGSAPPGRYARRLTHQRLYQVASFLLTVDLNTSIFSQAYPTQSHFQVFPESLIAPTNPAVPQPTSIAGLIIASKGGSDLYGREYLSCPVDGVNFTRCYVVVNPSTSDIAFRWPAKYVSTIKLSGSDLLDPPALISTSGPPPPAIVAAGTAVIALPKN